jgi:thiosulfate/3-mercaptopyruvate sulfurtransferase
MERDGVPAELPSLEELTRMVREQGIDDKKRIVIYDEALGRFAARTYLALDAIGLGGRASLLDGQLKTWKAENRPLSTEVPRVQPSTYTPRARPGVTVKMDAVKDLISGKGSGKEAGVKLVDSRSEKQYCGLEGGEGVARPGHIPGALNIPWKENLKSEENPVLKSPEELRALYEKAGVKPGDRVVTYCRAGSQSYFILKLLGHDVSLYDGSFSEWSAGKENPVARSEEKRAVK